MLIEISKIHIGGYAIIKTGRRKNVNQLRQQYRVLLELIT